MNAYRIIKELIEAGDEFHKLDDKRPPHDTDYYMALDAADWRFKLAERAFEDYVDERIPAPPATTERTR